MGTLVTLQGTTCDGSTYYTGYTLNRSTCELGPLVTGLVVPLGPLMQGILETPGPTVPGNLEHGRVKVVPLFQALSCFIRHFFGQVMQVLY
jgi:hypothetical protein